MSSINEERTRILNMIQDGKITTDEGARLLAALNGTQDTVSLTPNRPPSGLMLHIRVTDLSSGSSKANIQLPLSVVDAGLMIGARFIPEDESVDLSEFLNAVRSGKQGKIVDLTDDKGGEHIEVFIQ